jgi:hypothetical protein
LHYTNGRVCMMFELATSPYVWFYGMVYIAAFNETYHYGSICLEKKRKKTRDIMSSTFVFERLARYIFLVRVVSTRASLSLFS